MGEVVAWMTHGFRRGDVELSPRVVRLLFALVLLIALLGALRLALVSYVAMSARDLQGMRDRLSHLQCENAIIEMQVAEAQSAFALLERARELGLRPAERIEVVEP